MLDVAWGATHTELRLGAAGPAIIEVNPRLAGGMIPRLVHHALGVDLVGGVVGRAVGHLVDIVPRRHGGAAIRFLVADRSGCSTGSPGWRRSPVWPASSTWES
ncbi:cysteine synthase A/argininosuccinate lyase [Lentzea fradiae]|uniref:Cysteine synthase A/argininosuccinate lyase n=1 Tax=Lentzea fradiae TaxID=200378 RepID=A0A1G7WDY9_9PSEU|nr:cysteine synthase A/argininosuccinate lyase [Lentzea fradiae]